jgi:hypothetical protein
MFPDAFPNILPFRTVALQSLFLLMAVAIEAEVFRRSMKLAPKESVYFAASLNLFCVVLGWLTFLVLFNLSNQMPGDALAPLINFILFDNWSSDTATLLIVGCFVIFFASIAVKELGLFGLRYLLEIEQPKSLKENSSQAALPEAGLEATESPTSETARSTVFVRAVRQEPREILIEVTTILIANAWSYSAILVTLLIRQAFL